MPLIEFVCLSKVKLIFHGEIDFEKSNIGNFMHLIDKI